MNSKTDRLLALAHELHRSNQVESAVSLYRRYLELEPNRTEAWVSFGGLLLECNRDDEALEAVRQAVDLIPDSFETRLILAKIMLKMNKFDQVEILLNSMIIEFENNEKLHGMFRLLYYKQKNWGNLFRECHRFLDLNPSDSTAWEKCYLNLLFGHIPIGWDQYESRWTAPGVDLRPPSHVLPQPTWRGEAFVGKTLLLRWEQGFGDIIMFARFIPLAKARGGRVLLEVLPPLADLLETCPGLDGVVRDGDPIPPFDLQLPLLSLPRIFQTGLEAIPAEVPYLTIPNRVPHREGIDRIMAATTGCRRLGLVWAGSPKHPRDSERSIPPALLKPLEALPGVVWHSFHMEPGTEQPFPGIIPMGPVVRGNFADTAYALSAMEQLITVDTATAHLAGALGIPTSLMITAHPDWRWLMGRNDSPWYPGMRLYRQPEPGNWPAVIEKVRSDLVAGI